jgi:hypothetical protein
MVLPSLGDWAAFGSIAVVLAFRCGGWAWISGATGLLISRVIHRQEKEVEVQDSEVLAAWARREKAEQQTAEVLDHLDANHVIFHDVRVGKHPNALSHVVIGPAGVFLVSSISTRGPITETAASGVQISNVPLGVVVTTLLEQRHIVARLLKMKEQDLNVLVAIQPEKSNAFDPAIRRTLAVFGENDGELPFAQVVLAGPDALLAEVAPGLELVPRLTRATIIRRAKMRLVPAGAPTPSRWESSGTVRLSPVGQDGQAVAPVDLFANVDLSWISPGTSVDISTNAGVLRDLVVVSDPYTDRNGFLVVSLCVEEEWASALRAGRQPRAYPYPVSSIAPAA